MNVRGLPDGSLVNDPRVAVLTFTRDRLAYTAHCFDTLERNAGWAYDHFVLDQASTDKTWGWLQNWSKQDAAGERVIYRGQENVGICAGANMLLDQLDPARYDVIVRYDNDCEVTQPDTLKTCAELADRFGVICAPHVLGLNNPPPTLSTVRTGDHLIDSTAILGGIFMTIPSFLFWEHEFRYDETHQKWAGDEAIVPWWRARGGICGYVHGLTVNHYQTTNGQHARYPDYFRRRALEGAPA